MSDHHPSNALTPERAVRLLRAKAADLEARYAAWEPTKEEADIIDLAADVALIAQLLANEIERTMTAEDFKRRHVEETLSGDD